ncbi:MAG: hypothetical protein MUC34_03400, partial [Anaerolineae bacterium]|nr:hypothetical protein [Anaerolineae bacterium]
SPVRLLRRVDVPSRWTLLLIALWVLYRTRGPGIEVAWQVALALYALLTVATTAYWFTISEEAAKRRPARLVAYASFLLDGVLACALIWRDGGISSSLGILLVLLAGKAIVLSPVLPALIWFPFVFGPLYVGALWLASGGLAFLGDPPFLSRYAVLWISLIGAVIISYELRRRATETQSLSLALRQQRQRPTWLIACLSCAPCRKPPRRSRRPCERKRRSSLSSRHWRAPPAAAIARWR